LDREAPSAPLGNQRRISTVLRTYITAKTRLDNFKDRFRTEDGGASLVEYSILIGLITVAAIVAITGVGTYVSTKWAALDAAL
jgi:pilus assembly protein Flp/PilA